MAGELPLMAQFELMGTQVAEGRMSPLPIVEQLDIFEDFAACLSLTSGRPYRFWAKNCTIGGAKDG